MLTTVHDLRMASAQRYLRHLGHLSEEEGLSGAARAAVLDLTATLRCALDKRTSLAPVDITFRWQELEHIPDLELQMFVNQFSLGVGTENAPVVFMGTEEAGEALDPQSLGLHCLQAALWLANCPGPLFAKAVEGQEWLGRLDPPVADGSRRRYDIHTNDYFHVESRPGRGTWEVVAAVLGCDIEDMGDRCYQIERSAFAAMESYQGLAPSGERVRFLVGTVMPVLSRTASVLVLHGKMNDGNWHPSDEAIAAAFLGGEVAYSYQLIGTRRARWAERAGRKVFFVRALSGQNVDGRYLEWLRKQIGP